MPVLLTIESKFLQSLTLRKSSEKSILASKEGYTKRLANGFTIKLSLKVKLGHFSIENSKT